MKTSIGIVLLALGLTRLSYDIAPHDGLTTSLQFIGTLLFFYHVKFAFELFHRTKRSTDKAGDETWN